MWALSTGSYFMAQLVSHVLSAFLTYTHSKYEL